MANPRERRIGRTRRKLAAMMGEQWPELRQPVDPYELTPQSPIHASTMFDCCSWYADLPLTDGGLYHIYSWNTMGEIVKHGFSFTQNDYRDFELSSNEGIISSREERGLDDET